MPPPIAVDKEQVRMLVLNVGVREAARQMGINEKTVLHWSHTGNWLRDTRPQPALLPPPASMRAVSVGSVSPVTALENILREDGDATKLAGMRYARRVVEHASDMALNEPETALARAGDVKAALQSASIAGRWQEAANTSMIPVAFFTISQPREEHHAQVVEIESDAP